MSPNDAIVNVNEMKYCFVSYVVMQGAGEEVYRRKLSEDPQQVSYF